MAWLYDIDSCEWRAVIKPIPGQTCVVTLCYMLDFAITSNCGITNKKIGIRTEQVRCTTMLNHLSRCLDTCKRVCVCQDEIVVESRLDMRGLVSNAKRSLVIIVSYFILGLYHVKPAVGLVVQG